MSQLTIDASIENLQKVTEFVEEQLEKLDCPIKAMTQFSIAVDELFSNIARYAYNPDIGPVTVRVEKSDDSLSLCLSFIDEGVSFDPLKQKNPDTALSAEDREVGGLGIFMVKNIMDDVSYERKDGQNILKIRKMI